jgi:amino acid adenylation domain-containing protein
MIFHVAKLPSAVNDVPVAGAPSAAAGGHRSLLRSGLVQNALSYPDRARLLFDWNQTEADYPRNSCLHTLFEEQAISCPDAPAVEFQGLKLSYGELNARANVLARHLQHAGVGPEVLVGICLAPSLDLLVGLLGILKSGGAYVPMDPAYPASRLAFIMQDTAMQALLTQESITARLPVDKTPILYPPAAAPADGPDSQSNPTAGVTAENLAYVMYTSGSTGQPKGVMVTHRGLVNYLWWAVRAYRVAEGTGAPVQSSISFDLTVTSLFTPLLAGRCATLLPADPALNALSVALRQHDGYSLVKITPARLEMLQLQTRSGQRVPRAGAFVIGGEALSGADLEFWQERSPDTVLVNEYGPTETVVGCCAYFVPKGHRIHGPVPIGRPIANTQLYVLGPDLQPVPIGVKGELYIGGDGVARGYWKQPELTERHFISNPFRTPGTKSSGKLYRTGDLVRYLPDGNLEFLGRVDDQIKVSGFRIEPGEIEPVLTEHPGVRAAVVGAVSVSAGYKVLTAYCVPRRQPPPTIADLRAFLLNELPAHLVPTAFVWLEKFPLTINGKVDRDALAAIAREAEASRSAPVAEPRTDVERRMVSLWQDLFQRVPLGIHDSFFDLGGHSLLAVHLVSRINRVFNSHFEVVDLFQWPTIAQWASVLTAHKRFPKHSKLARVGSGNDQPAVVFLNPPTELVHFANHLAKPQAVLASEVPLTPELLDASARHELSRLPSLPEMAEPHVALIREHPLPGGIVLAGFSYGGLLAFEVASQLIRAGAPVRSVLLFDACRPLGTRERLRHKALRHLRSTPRQELARLWRKARPRVRNKLARPSPLPESAVKPMPEPPDWSSTAAYPWETYARIWAHAIQGYTWHCLPSRGALFRAQDTLFGPDQNYDGALGWDGLFEDGVQVYDIPGDHFSMWKEPHLAYLCEACLTALNSTGCELNSASRRPARSV